MSTLRSSHPSSKPTPKTPAQSPPAAPPRGSDAGQRPVDIEQPPPSRPKPPEPPSPSQLAFRSDFTVLLSVNDLADRDLTGRTLWTAIELTPEEVELVLKRGVDAEHEIAAKLINGIPKRRDPDDEK